MPNIELKARFANLDEARAICARVFAQPLWSDLQKDTYYPTRNGKLKLRESTLDGAELLPYLKIKHQETKRSDYARLKVEAPGSMQRLMRDLFGTGPVVSKKREVYLLENVRIHLDEVEKLGSFLEFEAVYEDDTPEAADRERGKVLELMTAFGLKESDLLPHSYVDMLAEREWSFGEYRFKVVHRFEEPRFQELSRQVFFGEMPTFKVEALLSEEERAQIKRHRANARPGYELRIAVYRGDEQVGWTFGWQDGSETFYMGSSAILPEHRKKGLYSELLRATIEIASLQGFQVIQSRHVATNNAVIVPKLKAGFVISGMELTDRFGTIVKLSYLVNPERRKLLEERAGWRRPEILARG